jgi:hypothetical protein
LARDAPAHQQRGDERSEPNGKARENDVEGDGKPKLYTRKQYGIEFHEGGQRVLASSATGIVPFLAGYVESEPEY